MNNTTEKLRAYDKVKLLVRAYDGTMTFHPMGSGGDWRIEINGKMIVVPCRDHRVNDLDNLYEPPTGVAVPATWEDYGDNAPLKRDASTLLWNFLEASTS